MIPTLDSILMLSTPGNVPSGNLAISLVWTDNNGIEDRICSDSSCPLTIKTIITNPMAVTITSKIQESLDNGSSWTDVTTSETYGDVITSQTKWFRGVILTSNDPIYSNILKYSKEVIAQNITISNIVSQNGNTTYDLTVSESAFIGFVNLVVTKRQNLKFLDTYFSPFGDDLFLGASVGQNVPKFKSVAVNIPVGIHQCSIALTGTEINSSLNIEGEAQIGYGITQDYYESICSADCIIYTE